MTTSQLALDTDKGTIFGRSGTSKRDHDTPVQFFTLIPMQFLVSAQSPWLASYERFEFGLWDCHGPSGTIKSAWLV